MSVAVQVLDFELQRQLVPYMKEFTPLPGIYDPDFIAANQDTRADNVISGSRKEQLETIRRDIRTFKEQSKVCKPLICTSQPAMRHLAGRPSRNRSKQLYDDRVEITPILPYIAHSAALSGALEPAAHSAVKRQTHLAS